MKNRIPENIKNNPILGNPNSDIMQIRNEVIRLQDEATKDHSHWINDGLRQHFEEEKRKLDEIQKRKIIHEQTQAAFAVDNLHPNPETQYIFDAYNNCELETIEDAIKALDEHYAIKRQK